MGSIPDAELRSILHSVFIGVCKSCDFVHGEALKPSGTTCLVQVCDFLFPARRRHPFFCVKQRERFEGFLSMADVCLCLCARVHTRVAVSVLVCACLCLSVCPCVCVCFPFAIAERGQPQQHAWGQRLSPREPQLLHSPKRVVGGQGVEDGMHGGQYLCIRASP